MRSSCAACVRCRWPVRRHVRQLEIPYGAFERRIALPAGRLEAGTPELVQGCLVVSLRRIGRER